MDLESEIKKCLESLDNRQKCQFAWVCGVRALPFLSVTRGFECWSSNLKQRHLYSIFNILDTCLLFSFSGEFYLTGANLDAKNIDPNIGYDYAKFVTTIIAYAIEAVGVSTGNCNDVNAPADTTAYSTYANLAISTAANFCATKAAITYAHIYATYIDHTIVRNIILDDINAILTNRFNEINIVGSNKGYIKLWKNFEYDLKKIGLGYWAKIYSDFISKRAFFNEDSLKQRINIPSEITEYGAKAVTDYLENVEEQGSVYSQRETRVIILGSTMAGKTTLARRLTTDMSYPAPEDRTHGVDTNITLTFDSMKSHILKHQPINTLLVETEGGETVSVIDTENSFGTSPFIKIKVHIWDFGGQAIYHSTHRCFMAANCVYILVVNARTQCKQDFMRINYWLDTIRVYSNNKAKVFIIFNESDNYKLNTEDYDSFIDDRYQSLIHDISSFNIGKDMTSINIFLGKMYDYIKYIGYQAFGKNDSHAIEEISILLKNKQIIETVEMEAILRKNGILKKQEQKRAVKLFDTLGIALSYKFGYVIDPRWISHGVYKVIDFLEKNNRMFISYLELDSVFFNEIDKYPKGKREYILDLMQHYKIGFYNKGGIRGLIVPSVASQTKHNDVIVEIDHDNIMLQIQRDNEHEFPADFFNRYVYANKNDLKEGMHTVWRNGMVLAGNRASALVELINNGKLIRIIVWGKGKEKYSEKLNIRIDKLLKDYKFISYEKIKKIGERIIKFITVILPLLK